MKRFSVLIISVIIALCAFSLVGCNEIQLKGNAFHYEKFEVLEGDPSEAQKAQIENELNNDLYMCFENDDTVWHINSKGGKFLIGTYLQTGDKFYIYDKDDASQVKVLWKIKGDRIYYSQTFFDDIVVRVYQVAVTNVKGKTFAYDSYQVTKGTISEDDKAQLDVMFNNGMEYVFGEDGKVAFIMNGVPLATAPYKQNLKKVVAGEGDSIITFTVDGDIIYMEEAYGEIATIRVNYKVK